MNNIKKFFTNSSIKYYLVYVVVAAVMAGLEILGEMLDILSNVHDGVPGANLGSRTLITLALRGLGWWILLIILLVALWKGGKKAYNSTASGLKIFKSRWKTWLIIMICWIPCFIAYFPGIYSYDGEPQLIQYTSGKFDNHHPVLHTLITGWCYDLGQELIARGINIDGIAFYSIIQMSLLAFAMSSVVIYLAKRNAGKYFIWLTMGLIVVFPVTPIMAISTTKDTFFTAFLVLLMLAVLGIEEGGKAWKVKGIEAGVYAVLCMLFRRNACYVFILMTMVACITLVICKARKNSKMVGLCERLAIVFVLSFVVFSVSEKGIMSATDAIQGESAEALSVPLMQMARAYKSNSIDVTNKYGDELFQYVTVIGLSNYRQRISDGVKQYFNNEHFAEDKVTFAKIYLNMFKDYPGSYAIAFLYLTKGDWQLMDNSHCEVYKDWWRDRLGYLITDATPVFAQRYVNKSNLWPAMRDVYESIATDSSYRCFFLFQLIFAPATFVFAVVLSGMVLIIQKKKSMFVIWLIVGFYLLTIIAGPCVLVRYIFPLMMLMPVLASMIFRYGDTD